LRRLLDRGVDRSTITHHVGHVTFCRPPDDTVLEDHAMEGERFAIPAATIREIEATRASGGRVVSVGTTSTRALGYAALRGGLVPGVDRVGVADLFIQPGHEFAVLDGLLTGLHAPKTTLFVLVSAVDGREAVLEAYRQAVVEGYRWYTLGDSMLIL
jgi:S-adenosylmethionine:tRNA ribosyltransferase-isomerase